MVDSPGPLWDKIPATVAEDGSTDVLSGRANPGDAADLDVEPVVTGLIWDLRPVDGLVYIECPLVGLAGTAIVGEKRGSSLSDTTATKDARGDGEAPQPRPRDHGSSEDRRS